MRTRTLAEIAAATGGTVLPPERAGVMVRGSVRIDSRAIQPGDLFAALPGDRSDGQAFAGAALAAGAAAALVRESRSELKGPRVVVPDVAAALLALAAEERSGLQAVVIGITGSTGKTCTKDFTAAVLSQRRRVVSSPASFNNEVGLPLTLLSVGEETEAVVCEMGSRGPGHIRVLCDVAHPDVGVVTNVGEAHMELFRSREALRDAKAELPECLPETGTAVLNGDDPVVRGFTARTRARSVMFGMGPRVDIRARHVRLDRETGCARFDLVTPSGESSVGLTVPGEHMIPDALAAAAVGWVLDVPVSEIAKGLSAAIVTGGRMEVLRTPEGIRVLNDAYNANPTSTAAALRAAKWMAGEERCIAVLGVMAELGPISAQEHERVGELLARLGIDLLVTVGEEALRIAVGAEREGFEPNMIVRCASIEEATAAVRALARPKDLILIKASRVARLERLVTGIVHAIATERSAPR